jgi:O-antigen/teichoic acid export membrane protein
MLISRLANVALLFVINVVLVRTLDHAEMATYLVIQGATLVASFAGTLGVGEIAVRMIASSRARSRPEEAAGVVTGIVRLFAIWLPCFGAAMAFVVLPLVVPASPGGGDAGEFHFLGALWACTYTMRMLLAGMLRGFEKMALAGVCDGTAANLAVLLALVVWTVLPWPLTLEIAVRVQALAGLAVVSIVSLALAGPVRRAPCAKPVPARTLVVEGVPCSAAALSGHLGGQLPIFCLAYLGTPSDVVFYGVALQVVNALMLFGITAHLIGGPVIATHAAAGRWRQLEDTCLLLAAAAGVPALLAGCLLIFWASSFLQLVFGPSYVGAAAVLQIVVVSRVFQLLLGPIYAVLVMAGYGRLYAAIQLIGLLARAVLVPIGFALDGLIGAALAASAVLIVESLALCEATRRKLGIRIHLPIRRSGWVRLLSEARACSR